MVFTTNIHFFGFVLLDYLAIDNLVIGLYNKKLSDELINLTKIKIYLYIETERIIRRFYFELCKIIDINSLTYTEFIFILRYFYGNIDLMILRMRNELFKFFEIIIELYTLSKIYNDTNYFVFNDTCEIYEYIGSFQNNKKLIL